MCVREVGRRVANARALMQGLYNTLLWLVLSMSAQMDWQVSSVTVLSFLIRAVLRLMLASRRLRSVSPEIHTKRERHACIVNVVATHQGVGGWCWCRAACCMF